MNARKLYFFLQLLGGSIVGIVDNENDLLSMNELAPVSPTQKPRPSWAKLVAGIAAIVLAAISWMIWFGHNSIMGTKYAVTTKENVDYSGNATEQEAKALGEELKKIGYFDDKSAADVLLHRDKDGTIVSFVVNAKAWTDDKMVVMFKTIGDAMAADLNLHPFKLRLIDDSLNTKIEIPIN
jgi:hypothetical protein